MTKDELVYKIKIKISNDWQLFETTNSVNVADGMAKSLADNPYVKEIKVESYKLVYVDYQNYPISVGVKK